MAKKSPIEKLALLSEDIEGLGFTDFKAWKKKRTELSRLVKRFPDDLPPHAAELCRLASEGLRRIGDQQITASLTGVETILDALSLSEQLLSGKSVDAQAVDPIRNGLNHFLESASTADPEPDSTLLQLDGTELTSLDDAAAFLIQLEPGRTGGAGLLRNFLADRLSREDCSDKCRQWLQQGIHALDGLSAAEDEPDRVVEILAEVGTVLENIMQALASPDEGDAAAPSPEDLPRSPASAPDPEDPFADHMPQDVDPDLLGEFIAESSDLIAAAEEALLLLETDPDDIEAVGKVFRAFHTVKGTAAFLDLHLIADLGHHAETLFSRVRDGEIRYSGGYADTCLRALDMIKELVERAQQALSGDALLKPDGYDALKSVLVDPEAAGISEDSGDQGSTRVGDILVAQGKAERARIEKAIDAYPDEKLGVAVVKSKAASAADVGQALRVQRRMTNPPAVVQSSVRVGTRRLDRLIDMVGELVIAFSMVAQDEAITGSDDHDLAKKVGRASKIVRELQDISMSMRMVPLRGTFNKMARLVRDLSRKTGKSVHFRAEGEDTEIDRNLVDIINDPLIHMVRNAVDHGIETPAERKANGKPQTGEIKLWAYHSAGCVVVEIADDGKGLDRDGIIAKAREKGMLPDTPGFNRQKLSDREVYNTIFEPGFSTARTVTDVSGRGVGMDVVKKNIESLRGQVDIRSAPGQGSVFRLSLPLTLAIIDGMVVRVGREKYVIPTVSIIRSIRAEAEDLSTVLAQGEMLLHQGTLVPLFRISRLYQLEDAREDLMSATIVVVEDEDRQAGLVVDELVGRQQVVIKSLGETLQDLPGISGGGIMPDGRVGLILDVGGLIKFAAANRQKHSKAEIAFGEQKTIAA
jgi:two-component system chemotaxis sensor kinase CheA